MSKTKAHAVVIAWPAQGHVNPLMRFAKLLHTKGFHITFVHTEYNYNRLIRSHGPDSVKNFDDFSYETIPDGTPPPPNPDTTQDIPLVWDTLRRTALGPFKKLLHKLNDDDGVPDVTCVVADGVMTFAVRAAELLGIPGINLITHSTVSFVAYLHTKILLQDGVLPLKDDSFLTDGTLDKTVEVPGLGTIPLKYLPSFVRTTDADDIMLNYMWLECWDCLKASALVLNTFEGFEGEAVEAIKTKYYNHPDNIYCISPLSLLEKKHVPENINKKVVSSLWKPDSKVFDWLDGQKPQSVMYVNYGCVAVLSSRDFKELAWGIANSKQPFLWIVRPDVVKDGATELPEGFVEDTKGRGFVTSWCAQEKVLCHPAVGAFFTHCGWNSVTETIVGGQPVICWPWFGDQQTNCYYLCKELEMGMEVDADHVERDTILSQIKEMMTGELGRKMRKNAQAWKLRAEKATDVGGSSCNDLDKLIRDVLLR